MGFNPTAADERTKVATKEVIRERVRQEELWGVQHHPPGACIDEGPAERDFQRWCEEQAKREYEAAAQNGTLTWTNILAEEFFEAMASITVEDLRKELIQLAAVACAIVEDIDSQEEV